MSSESPPGTTVRRSARKRVATEAAELLEQMTPKHTRTPRKTAKTSEGADTPLDSPRTPSSKIATPRTTSPVPTEVKSSVVEAVSPSVSKSSISTLETPEVAKETVKVVHPPAKPVQDPKPAAVKTAKSPLAKSASSIAPTSTSTPSPPIVPSISPVTTPIVVVPSASINTPKAKKTTVTTMNQKPSMYTEQYVALRNKKYIPYRPRRGFGVYAANATASNPTDQDIAEAVADVSQIVQESQVISNLQQQFAANPNAIALRPLFIKEVLRIVSI